MFTFGLHSRNPGQDLILAAFHQYEICQLRLAPSQGAGFIEDDGVHPRQCLQGRAFAEQHAHFGALTGSDHNGCWRSQSHRAGTSDQQYADRRDEGKGQGWLGPEAEPGDERQNREHNHNGNENSRYLVGQRLNRGFISLGRFHHSDDLCQNGVRTDPRSPERQGTVLINGSTHQLGVFLFGHGNGLAADHGLVHVGLAFFHHAINRNPLSRAHLDTVTRYHGFDGHFDGLPVPNDTGGLGLQLQKFFDCLRRPAFGDVLEVASQQNERHDYCRCLEIAFGGTGGKESWNQQCCDGVEIGSAGADHNQAVHARIGMAQFSVPGPEKPQSGIKQHRRG